MSTTDKPIQYEAFTFEELKVLHLGVLRIIQQHGRVLQDPTIPFQPAYRRKVESILAAAKTASLKMAAITKMPNELPTELPADFRDKIFTKES